MTDAKPPLDTADFAAGLAEADRWKPKKLPVGGRDAKAFGVAPGPPVGAALAGVEEWWIAGDFKATRKQALAKHSPAPADRPAKTTKPRRAAKAPSLRDDLERVYQSVTEGAET